MDLVLNLDFIKEYYIWRVQMLVDLSLEMHHFVTSNKVSVDKYFVGIIGLEVLLGVGTVIGLEVPSEGGLYFMTRKVMLELYEGVGSIGRVRKCLER